MGAVLATAHDMAREHRIISAVGASTVPVPPALGLCMDEEVNGAPFYVMDYSDGRLFKNPHLPGMTAAERAAISRHQRANFGPRRRSPCRQYAVLDR